MEFLPPHKPLAATF